MVTERVVKLGKSSTFFKNIPMKLRCTKIYTKSHGMVAMSNILLGAW